MTPEERREYDKAYNEANKEKKKAQRKANYEKNKERILSQQKAYYEASKEARKVHRDTVTYPYRSLIDVPEGYVVHHLNHDHSDNRPSNLLAMTRADHSSYHAEMKRGYHVEASEIIYNYTN